jgi:predicted TIM-barrel fold metal-dependent hydrolase
MTIIDAHDHVIGDHPETLALLERHDVTLLNVCFAETGCDWRGEMAEPYRRLAQQHPERYAWCTTFDAPAFDMPTSATDGYADRVIAGLEQDFAAGALACKVWKNVGMEVRGASGAMLLVDDPLFEPIFGYLARSGRPLLMHVAEPIACWRPLDEPSPHQAYYRAHPQWHMHGRTDVPSHEALIASRDRLVARHPRLRVVGAHLGSLEHDLDALGESLERHPNFAVDISARLGDLLSLERGAVRRFFLRHADRILFGTDAVMRTPHSRLDAAERTRTLEELEATYRAYFRFLGTDRLVRHAGVAGRGIALPDGVLERVYRANARDWYGV